MTKLLEAIDVITRKALGFEAVKKVGAQIRILPTLFQEIVENYQDGMPDGDESAFLSPASHQASVLRGQVTVLGVARRPGRLHYGPFQPPIAWRDTALPAVPVTFFIPRTHPRPARQVPLGWKRSNILS